MYIKDGSNQDYGNGKSYLYLANDLIVGRTKEEIIENPRLGGGAPEYPNVYAWGWIGDKVENPGWTSSTSKGRIIEIISEVKAENCLDLMLGSHSCEICKSNDISCGSIKIEYNDKIYISPWGVSHYIKEHDYHPIDEVISAIQYGHYLTEKDQTRMCFELHSKEIYERVEEIKKQRQAEKEKWDKKKQIVQTPEFKARLQRIMDEALEPFTPDQENFEAQKILARFDVKRKEIEEMTNFFKRNLFPLTPAEKKSMNLYLKYCEKEKDNFELRNMDRVLYREQNPVNTEHKESDHGRMGKRTAT